MAATPKNSVRADWDASGIVVYQAFGDAIADDAVRAGRFVPPFSMGRMTWIKPSFLWLMERSNWGWRAGQERTLAVRITRAGWEEALSLGVLTHPEPAVWPDPEAWRQAFTAAPVHIQWDPERTLRGAALEQGSIQVGLSRHVIERYVEEWTVSITDMTPAVRKMRELLAGGHADRARRLLPTERPYPLLQTIARRINASA
jgi:hypothetical protein